MKLNKLFFKKFFLIAGMMILTLIVILAVIYTVLNIKWGGELRSELEKLKASGEPMTAKDIMPAPLASSENASIEYLQIFSLMTDGTFSMNGPGDESKDMKELDTLCFSAKNFGELKELCEKNSVRIREILDTESFKQIFQLCQKAAAKLGMNFNLNYDEGPYIQLPHLRKMRGTVRLLRVKAEMEMLGGEREKAWETIYTALKLSSHLKNESLLISQLVYFACNNICFEFISYNLPRYGISDENAVKLIAELAPEKSDYLKSMKKTMDAERICFGGWIFERVISGSMDTSDIWKLGGDSEDSYSFITKSFIYKPFAKKDYTEYMKIMESYDLLYDQPYYKLVPDTVTEQKALASLPRYCLLTKTLIPSLRGVRQNTAKISTRSQEIRFRLALEEYKNLKGAYPDKIDLLAPQFLKEIPLSEMTGRFFEYSKDKDSYKISGGIPEKK